MNPNNTPKRCRIILTLDTGRGILEDMLGKIIKAGDIASIILYSQDDNSALFQKNAAELVAMIQDHGIAAIIAEDSRIAGRLKADGLHVEGKSEGLRDALTRKNGAMMMGCGNLRDRHTAMEIGELEPDYVMFGKLGADKKPEPHPRNLKLGEWWSSMVEIPCIVQAGSDIKSVVHVAETGADFVALEEAVFGAEDMVQALAHANHLLDTYTPAIGDYDE